LLDVYTAHFEGKDSNAPSAKKKKGRTSSVVSDVRDVSNVSDVSNISDVSNVRDDTNVRKRKTSLSTTPSKQVSVLLK